MDEKILDARKEPNRIPGWIIIVIIVLAVAFLGTAAYAFYPQIKDKFFKSKSEIGNRLEALLKGNSVWTCGIAMFELLQGVKSDSERETILGILSTLPYLEMSIDLW